MEFGHRTMMGTVLRLSVFLLVFVPHLAACKSMNTPDDLAFLSIQAVDYHDQDEVAPPSIAYMLPLVKDRELLAKMEPSTNDKKPHRLVLRVEFRSDIDLSRFVLDHGYNIGNSSFFCDRPDDRVILSSSSVYWRNLLLGVDGPIPETATSSGAPITYHMFVDASRKETLPSKPPLHSYDLRKSPEDVCFYVSGGNNMGFGYKSNVVVIPRDAIASALRAAPPGLGEGTD